MMHTPPAPSKPDALAQDPSQAATPGLLQAEPGLLTAEVGGRLWQLSRPADLESLWAEMGEAEFGPPGWEEDERLPYWVELWPAAVLLARFVAQNAAAVRGKVCLDAGCGLGLSALVAASVGGRVLGFDYEPEALVYARRNTTLNQQLLGACAPPLFTVMDWRAPALARGSVDLLLGADILYEKRFFEPVAALLDYALAPNGAAFIADPERSVSAPVWARLTALGWNVETPFSGRVAQGGQDMFVHIRKISRPRRGQPPTETCKEP